MRCASVVRIRHLSLPLPNDSTCACNDCGYMKLNTLEKLYNCLRYEQPEVNVDADTAARGRKPIERMLEISAKLGL